MQVIYYYDEPPVSYSKSIFLAGPSPRTQNIVSWRKDALRLLELKGYDGIVFIPEPNPADENNSKFEWSKAPHWEYKMLSRADIILFWVPRDMRLMLDSMSQLSKELAAKKEREVADNFEPELRFPGMTTNIEFGYWANSGKAVLGHPIGASQTRYLSEFMTNKFYVPFSNSLGNIIDKALKIINAGALRTGGERDIPLNIWRMRAFQNWYQSQTNAGNRLDGAKIEWISRVLNNPKAIFMVALRPNIYVVSEDRNKFNDPVVIRLDISSVVLYKIRADLFNSEVVLIKEFRSAASTPDGFIWELPGGSSPYLENPLEVAIEEVREEVGLEIEADRFRQVGSRQMAGTLSGHKSHTYAVELTEAELTWLKNQKGLPHGSDYPHNSTGERIYTEVVTLKEVISNPGIDFANLGMILTAL